MSILPCKLLIKISSNITSVMVLCNANYFIESPFGAMVLSYGKALLSRCVLQTLFQDLFLSQYFIVLCNIHYFYLGI